MSSFWTSRTYFFFLSYHFRFVDGEHILTLSNLPICRPTSTISSIAVHITTAHNSHLKVSSWSHYFFHTFAKRYWTLWLTWPTQHSPWWRQWSGHRSASVPCGCQKLRVLPSLLGRSWDQFATRSSFRLEHNVRIVSNSILRYLQSTPHTNQNNS